MYRIELAPALVQVLEANLPTTSLNHSMDNPMQILKSIIASILTAAGVLSISAASAYTPTGTPPAGPGPTNLFYAGINFPCTGNFTITVGQQPPPPAHAPASVSVATFGTNALCVSITPMNLPWLIGAATGGPSIYTAPVTGVIIRVGSLGVICTQGPTDTVIMTLDDLSGVASFNGTLHNGTIPCNVSGSGLATALRAP